MKYIITESQYNTILKIIIRESRAVDLMKSYLKENFPTILEPFIVKLGLPSVHNLTGLNIDRYYTRRTYYCDKFDTVWITKNDDRDGHDMKYELNIDLETMYYLFGQELFEIFFLELHGIDLKDKGTKDDDWFFVY